MSNIDKILQSLSVHEPVNPPHENFGITVNMNHVNQKHFSITNWEKGDQPSFTLEIIEPQNLGLVDFQQSNTSNFINQIILACNLTLNSVAFSSVTNDSSFTIVRKKEGSTISIIKDYTSTGNKSIVVNEIAHVTDYTTFGLIINDELDETQVIDTLQRIQKCKNLNLLKSFNAYSSAMSSFDQLTIFKELFSSIELAVNSDGKKRSNHFLDEEVDMISGIKQLDFESFRRFNGMAKHGNEKHFKVAEYKLGINNLGKSIYQLRKICQKIILKKIR